VAEGFGSWLESISFLGDQGAREVWWSVDDPRTEWTVPATLLESDSSLRKDRLLIQEKDYKQAEIEKTELEAQQRKD
jgi:hypothetical protein